MLIIEKLWQLGIILSITDRYKPLKYVSNFPKYNPSITTCVDQEEIKYTEAKQIILET